MTKQMITIEVPDPPPNLEYTDEYRCAEINEPCTIGRGFYTGPTFQPVLILRKIKPLWVAPKGVFKPGWITRDEGSRDFGWHEKDPLDFAERTGWSYGGMSRMLWGIHPDNLPPLTIPAHMCKFRVGDE